jgi:hypothetical protein
MNDAPIILKELSIEFATTQTTVFHGVALPYMHCGQVIIENGMVVTSSTMTKYEMCILVAQSGATMVRTDNAIRLMVAGDSVAVNTPFQLTNVNSKPMPSSIVFFAVSDATNLMMQSVDNRSVDNDD